MHLDQPDLEDIICEEEGMEPGLESGEDPLHGLYLMEVEEQYLVDETALEVNEAIEKCQETPPEVPETPQTIKIIEIPDNHTVIIEEPGRRRYRGLPSR